MKQFITTSALLALTAVSLQNAYAAGIKTNGPANKLLADSYGGAGLGTSNIQIKGIGRTPLTRSTEEFLSKMSAKDRAAFEREFGKSVSAEALLPEDATNSRLNAAILQKMAQSRTAFNLAHSAPLIGTAVIGGGLGILAIANPMSVGEKPANAPAATGENKKLTFKNLNNEESYFSNPGALRDNLESVEMHRDSSTSIAKRFLFKDYNFAPSFTDLENSVSKSPTTETSSSTAAESAHE